MALFLITKNTDIRGDDNMALPLTIEDLINAYRRNEKSYKNLHENVIINLNKQGEYIQIPYGSITNKYRDFLAAAVITVPLTSNQADMYRYQPRLLAKDLYGSAELWFSILEINNMCSVIEFRDIQYLRLYEPEIFYKLLNEIMIMENLL